MILYMRFEQSYFMKFLNHPSKMVMGENELQFCKKNKSIGSPSLVTTPIFH